MKRKPTATDRNIGVINRRLELVAKLFGIHSEEYEMITNELHGFEFRKKGDGYVLRNTKTNRDQYQRISAWANRIRKTPTAVLQRKAGKKHEEFEDYRETTDDNSITFEAYQYWSNEIGNLKDEVYTLVGDGESIGLLDEEEHNYNLYVMFSDPDARFSIWQDLRKHGFYEDVFPVEDYREVEYTIDPETGEIFENPAFFGDI